MTGEHCQNHQSHLRPAFVSPIDIEDSDSIAQSDSDGPSALGHDCCAHCSHHSVSLNEYNPILYSEPPAAQDFSGYHYLLKSPYLDGPFLPPKA